MPIIQLILLAIGLAMDAFAVAISKGLNMTKINYKNAITIAVFFGGFHVIMPIIGYFFGSQFSDYVAAFDHWVVFGILVLLGIQMIYEAFRGKADDDKGSEVLLIGQFLVLSVATSIDDLAVGISFALIPNVNIWFSSVVIGAITFVISFLGVVIGNRFGVKYKKGSEIFGGLILIFIGAHVLLESYGMALFQF